MSYQSNDEHSNRFEAGSAEDCLSNRGQKETDDMPLEIPSSTDAKHSINTELNVTSDGMPMEFQVHSCDQIETNSSNRQESTNHTTSAKTANSSKDISV